MAGGDERWQVEDVIQLTLEHDIGMIVSVAVIVYYVIVADMVNAMSLTTRLGSTTTLS